MKKKILFRCDSSSSIGTGHVMRCLALAVKLRELGHTVEFASRKLAYNINNVIEKKNFKLWTLNEPSKGPTNSTGYNHWLGVSPDEEIQEIKDLLRRTSPDLVIVDHYGLGIYWEREVLHYVRSLLVIDDLFREHECSYLLDQNYHREHAASWRGKVAEGTTLFLGPEYALLSEELTRFSPRHRSGPARLIVAFFGGVDALEGSEKFLRSISSIDLSHLNVKLFVGAGNNRFETIAALARQNVEVIKASPLFYQDLNEADLFVGAAGTTTWERSFLGVPSISVSIAANQEQLATELDAVKAHRYLGGIEKVADEQLASSILDLLNDADKRSLYSRNSLNLNVAKKIKDLLEKISF